MKFVMVLLFVVLLSNPASARQRGTEAGLFKYWSPGAFTDLIRQNSGPRMVYRGDWVIVRRNRR